MTTPTPKHAISAGRIALAVAALALTTAGCSATVTARDADASADVALGDGALPTDASPPPTSRLPDGTWEGTLERTCSDGTVASERCETRITANAQLTDCTSGGLTATTLDRYTFTAPDAAIWHDLQGGELGRCTLMGTVLVCQVTASTPVQVRRTLDFTGGALAWSDETTAQGVTCRRRGTLRSP
jgi:hypothetical protein